MKSDQLSLFPTGSASDTARDGSADRAALDARYEKLREIARELPDTLRMGTSSWSFPGWRGIVYSSAESTTTLAREGLQEYAQHPLLRTVGLDRSYYAPIPEDDLRRYASQLPDGFLCCAKLPGTLTAYTVPGAPRPQPNPDFLSADRFIEDVLTPFDRAFAAHTGPFILQFPPLPARATLDPSAFAEMLDAFFDRLPRSAEYAVEIRDRSLLTEAYRRVLARNAVAHVYNYWSAMPMPGEQVELIDPSNAPFTLVRLLMRPGTRYAQQKETMAPFNRIVQQDEYMRRDVTAILRKAAAAGQRAFLLVNNKAEGSSPLTIEAIAERLRHVRRATL
ncbi:MAG TPA: DUF72 domain-containing protein [Vicinamibacterales bacterium]